MESNDIIIPYGQRPGVLLLGNGINRLFSSESWGDIIKDYAVENHVEFNKAVFDRMPYNMQIVAATRDTVDKSMKSLCAKLNDIPTCEKQKDFMKNILDLGFTHILTSNYTYEIERSITEKKRYRVTSTVEKYNNTKDMMLHREITLEDRHIWHIHGHVQTPDSVIMGHYYYGRLLSKIQEYVPQFIRRYKGCEHYEKNCRAESWVDLFLCGDVHILGLSMDFSENDLWWLACCKKRNFPDSKIYFYGAPWDISEEKRMMMNCYGIVIPKIKCAEKDYMGLYLSAVEEIKKRICDENCFVWD